MPGKKQLFGWAITGLGVGWWLLVSSDPPRNVRSQPVETSAPSPESKAESFVVSPPTSEAILPDSNSPSQTIDITRSENPKPSTPDLPYPTAEERRTEGRREDTFSPQPLSETPQGLSSSLSIPPDSSLPSARGYSTPSLQSVLSQSLRRSAMDPHNGNGPAGLESQKLDKIIVQKGQSPDAVVLDPMVMDFISQEKMPPMVQVQERLNNSSPSSSSQALSPTERLMPASPPKATQNDRSVSSSSVDEASEDPPPFPPAGSPQPGGTAGGDRLPLAKPYCFLLPKDSPALECAMASVKRIVDVYAQADVHVIPVFRWWGNDYSDDPGTLEQQATAACNLEKAFPWLEGGNKVASIQAFVRHPIPSYQCGKDPVKDPVSGCSNLCPSGSPSFSTVSEQQCSADVALHESGHSNCCAAQCKNQGDCQPKPEIDGGCGLCVMGGASAASLKTFQRFLASQTPAGSSGCMLTSASLASIRAGASKNPGYVYNPNTTYKPRGKKLDSIYGRRGIKKLLRGLGDDIAEESGSLSEAPPPESKGQSSSRTPAANNRRSGSSGEESRKVPGKNQKGYTEQEVEDLVGE